MMISPEMYLSEHENDSFPQLIQERNSLLREIRRLEKYVFCEDRTSEEWCFKPGPDVCYQMNLEYLSALCLFISRKYNREIVHREEG